jgi:plasmid stabilization system protein ParE
MKIEFSNRAVADLRKVLADSHRTFGARVAEALDARIGEVVTHAAENPEAAPQVTRRSGVRVIPLVRYPYRIFYRLLEDRIRVLHIRHTSRHPWMEEC